MKKISGLLVLIVVLVALFFLTKGRENQTVQEPIEQLTREEVVISYVQQQARLPEYYVTKREAQDKGWVASKGNLCDVLPGKAIGGDRFSNRERQLPDKTGRKWTEADINYHCGHRGAARLVYSNDGLIYITHDHYKHFAKAK